MHAATPLAALLLDLFLKSLTIVVISNAFFTSGMESTVFVLVASLFLLYFRLGMLVIFFLSECSFDSSKIGLDGKLVSIWPEFEPLRVYNAPPLTSPDVALPMVPWLGLTMLGKMPMVATEIASAGALDVLGKRFGNFFLPTGRPSELLPPTLVRPFELTRLWFIFSNFLFDLAPLGTCSFFTYCLLLVFF